MYADDVLLLPPQVPQVDEVKRVILYNVKNQPLVRPVGFRGEK